MPEWIARVLVELTVLLHFGFVLFVVLGGLLVLRSARWAWLHVPSVLYGTMIELVGWICPLTPLEQWFRVRARWATYEGGFLEHHLEPLIYPGWLDRSTQLVLGSALLGLNLLVYTWAWRKHRVRRKRSAG